MSNRGANQSLSTSGDLRRRFLLHHLPLALVSAVVLFLWMRLPLFEAAGHQGPPPGVLHDAGRHGPVGAAGHHGPLRMGAEHRPMDRGGTEGELPAGIRGRRFLARLTTGTGYVALGLLAVTLLIGPANLLLRRRNPVSSNLRRDVGMWTAILSVVHVFTGFGVHGPPGPVGERVLHYFFTTDGQPLTNSFGLGNWTGLAATLIAMGLLAISSDLALRKLKAGPWKRVQRLNYALFILVIAHALFYGALSRMTSPSTLLLALTTAAVFAGQVLGVWLWRRRYARTTATSS